MMEQALTDYVGATILALTPHFTPVASWHDPGMPAAAIVLDGYRRQITWTPDSGWRYTRLHTGTAAQRGPAYYLDAGPVPAPQVLVDRLRRWQSGGESWSLTQPSYPPGGVLEALRAAVPDPSAQRSCPDCGQWTAVDPADRDVCCETCGTRLLDAQATTRAETPVSDPMTPERLAEIRERAKRCEVVPDHPGSMFSWQDSAKDVPALLAEVDRLENANRGLTTVTGTVIEERNLLREQVKRVREKHGPIAAHYGDPDDDDNLVTACGECEVPYPCDTVRALDGSEAGR